MLIRSVMRIDRTRVTNCKGFLDVIAGNDCSDRAVHIKSLDKALARNYCFRMVIKSIREFNRAVPFMPYEIHTASGESYEVPHPDFVSISPRGSYVIIIDQEERPHHLNSLLIDRASPLDNPKRPKGKKQS
jgi:hypothetical protein